MTELKPPHDPVEALGEAYELMLERIGQRFQQAEEKSGPVMKEAIAETREKMAAAKELTREEADRLADYVQRDLADLGGYLSETGRELKDWLGFETRLLEDRFLESLMNVADQTEVDWTKLRLQAEQAPYRTGEVVAPGTFVCLQCGERIHLHKPGHLPPCPKCAATEFRRVTRET